MHARTTLLEIDTVRVPLDDALARFEAEVLPRLKSQPGFEGVYVLTTPEGRAMLVTFWDRPEQADAWGTQGWYPEVLREYTTLFRSPPGREHYEVRLAMAPTTAAAEA
jgi:heme-degrading monooxygenase HmoA